MSNKNNKELIGQLIDLHTHYGPYGDFDFSPEEVVQKMKKIGLRGIGIMQAPMKDDNYMPDNHKLLKVVELTGSELEIIPILMTSPAMVKNDPTFTKVKNIPYKIIKIHPYAHNWAAYPELVVTILNHAKASFLPVMIHTGYDESEPKNFESWFKNYPEIQFILAHGKPAVQAAQILQKHQNAWVDISFMEIEGIKLLLKNNSNANQRILFGTDAPITELFYNLTTEEYCFNRINELVECFGEETLLLWGNSNVNALI